MDKKPLVPSSFILLFIIVTIIIICSSISITTDFEYYGIIIGAESVLLGFVIILLQQLRKEREKRIPLLFHPIKIIQIGLLYYIFSIIFTVILMIGIINETDNVIKLNVIVFIWGFSIIFVFAIKYISFNPDDLLNDYWTSIHNIIDYPWIMKFLFERGITHPDIIIEMISQYTIELSIKKRLISYKNSIERMFEESEKLYVSINRTVEPDETELVIHQRFTNEFFRIFEGVIENRPDSEIFLKYHKEYLLAIWRFNRKNIRKMDSEKICRFSEEIRTIRKFGEIGFNVGQEDKNMGVIINLIIDEIDQILKGIGDSIREWKRYKVIEREMAAHLQEINITLLKDLNYFGIESAKRGLERPTYSYLNLARLIDEYYQISKGLKMDLLSNCWLSIFYLSKVKSIEDVKTVYKEFIIECGQEWIEARDRAGNGIEENEIDKFQNFIQKIEEV